jgi:hypothetical protein
MIGAGAIIGSVLGGNGNAARSPGTPPRIPSEAAIAAPEALAASAHEAASDTAPTAAVAVAAVAPAAAVAMRFPPRWHAGVTAAPENGVAPQTMAYAPESRAAGAPAPANSGYQLASVDPASTPELARAPLPPKRAKPAKRNPLLFNDAQLASIKSRLNLSPQQEQYWPQVEQALRAISWRLATQQDPKRPVRGNQAAMIDPNSPEVAKLKSAALPLIMSLRPDQKDAVRQLAHTMGLSKVAAMF